MRAVPGHAAPFDQTLGGPANASLTYDKKGESMVKKDWDKVIEAAVDQGWRSEATKDGLQLFAPDGVGVVTMHGTPSDQRAIKNAISRLRRHGFRWPPK